MSGHTVAAYQAPVSACYSTDVIDVLREQVQRCESLGVEILCCPEGIVGGLADYADTPTRIGINVGAGELEVMVAPLLSPSVTTILGFSEIDDAGRLYNAAAVVNRGSIVGVYRKLHPAINSSVYSAGSDMPIFTVGPLTFGILICRDSLHPVPARRMVAGGATALFIPTNNAMPRSKGGPELVGEARHIDVQLATELGVAVIRADVVGEARGLVSDGASGIVSRDGEVLAVAPVEESALVVAEIETCLPARVLRSSRPEFYSVDR